MPVLKPSWSAILAIAAIVVVTPTIGSDLYLSSSLRSRELPVNQPHDSSLTIAQLNPRSEITRFYKELLGRAPDANGLSYHLGRYNQGRSLGLIEQDIRNSPEGRRMVLLLSSDAYAGTVRSIYLTELRREPEPAGLAYYVRQLDRAGISPSDIQAEIRATPEARIKREISSIHQRILGRDLDNTQLQYYYGEVAAGRRTLAALQEEFQRQANSQVRPTPTTPQPTIAPSPTPMPTTPGDLRPPRPNPPVVTTGNAYYVVVPGGNLTEISQRMVQLGAPAGNVQARQQPRGPHVALGPFDDRRLANQWTTYLRGNGLDARVYYGQ